jgi:signal transduction histidine kinase
VRQPNVFRTTAFRWALAFACFFLVGSLLLFGFIYWQAVIEEELRIDELMANKVATLAADPLDRVRLEVLRHIRDDPEGASVAELFDAEGHPLEGDIATLPPQLSLDGAPHEMTVMRADKQGNRGLSVHAAGLRLADGGILMIGRNIEELGDLRRFVAKALLLGVLPAIVLAVGGGILLGLRAQRRLRQIAGSAELIMAGQLSERLPVEGSDEIQHLAEIVNRMLDEIERLMHEIRDVGDEIAHDLRTPLTRVRARLERARDGAATRVELVETADKAIAGIDQALGIITALLRIAEIEHSERRVSFRAVDLAEVVREAAELYEPIAEDKGLMLATEAGSVAVFGDRDLLLEAIVNLVDNAVKFTPAGGKVWLAALKTPTGAILRVADTGPGIEESEREAVLRRFYRADKSRHTEGTGLGLSLVAAIARMHGFSLNIRGGDAGCVVELGCATAAPLG